MPKYATLVEFKEHLAITTNPTESPDAYLISTLERAEAIIDAVLGRSVETANRTEYHDGDGSNFLDLANGPFVAYTSLEEIAYDSAGSETETAVPRGDFRIYGLATEDWQLPSYIRGAGGFKFVKGERNYKTVCQYGWDFTQAEGPQRAVQQAALFAATWIRQKRKDAATSNREIATASIGPFSGEDELSKQLRAQLAHFIGVH